MAITNFVKKVTVTSVLGLTLLVANPFSQAEAATSPAQKLVDSLKAMNLGNVDYLYAYLQTVDLTNSEYNSIMSNAKQASALLSGVSSPEELSDADKAKIGRLFLDSAQKAHLQVAFVDKNGNPMDLQNLTAESVQNLSILIMDKNGNILATVDPKKEDFTATAFSNKINALSTAINAKVELEKEGTFVPMPSSKLPDTATDLPAGIALGGLLAILGSLALIPSVRAVRKLDNQA